MMRSRTSDPVTIEQINRREVAAHRAEAAASAGLARQAHLADAIEIARARGLSDVVREVTAELQAIPVNDLGLRRHSTSVRVPADQVERFLHGFTASPKWRDGMRFFLNTDCPTGDVAQLRQQAHDIARVAPLVSVIPTSLLGGDGLPRWTAQSPEEQEAGRMATCARIRAELQGQYLAQGLHRLAERYGIPDEASLVVFLSENGQSDSALAASLARAFLHFWQGDYEACAHVAVPKIEAAARVLLRELDEGIYKLQLGKDQGQYPVLYSLLKELEQLAMDESWTYFLRWLLLAPPGMNIRNDLAHGFISVISPVYAVLILRAAAMLITVTAPQPPAAAHVAAADQPADLAPLPHRDRDDILGLLSYPVSSPVPAPWRRAGRTGRRDNGHGSEGKCERAAAGSPPPGALTRMSAMDATGVFAAADWEDAAAPGRRGHRSERRRAGDRVAAARCPAGPAAGLGLPRPQPLHQPGPDGGRPGDA
jgi:hypothetical protein